MFKFVNNRNLQRKKPEISYIDLLSSRRKFSSSDRGRITKQNQNTTFNMFLFVEIQNLQPKKPGMSYIYQQAEGIKEKQIVIRLGLNYEA